MRHLPSLPQISSLVFTNLQHICMEQICANPFFCPVIHSQNGKTVCPLYYKCQSTVYNVFAFSSAPISIHMYVSVFKTIKIALYIYIYNSLSLCLISGSCLLNQHMKSIIVELTRILTTSHYLLDYQGIAIVTWYVDHKKMSILCR